MDADEQQAEVPGDGQEALLQDVDLDSGSPEAFIALHDPAGWLQSRGLEDVTGKKLTTTIVNHEHGLRKRIIRVSGPWANKAGGWTITFTKHPPEGNAPEPIGYKFEGEDG